MPTLQQLDALANQVPVLNKKAAAQGQAQRGTQLQAQIGSAQTPAGQSATRSAQAAAPGVIATEGAAAAKTIEANTAGLSDVAGVALGVQGANADASLARQQSGANAALTATDNANRANAQRNELAMRKRVTGKEQASQQRLQKVGIEVDNKLQVASIRQRKQLESLGGDVKTKILDSRLQFERDDMGRKFTNDRQLADYVTANVKSDIEFKAHAREIEQASDRKLQLMEIAERRLSQSTQQDWQGSEAHLNNENRARIARLAADMRAKIAKEQSASKGRMAMWQAGGMIVGAIVGGVIGTFAAPGVGTVAGASAGASVGGAAGTMAGGYAEGE